MQGSGKFSQSWGLEGCIGVHEVEKVKESPPLTSPSRTQFWGLGKVLFSMPQFLHHKRRPLPYAGFTSTCDILDDSSLGEAGLEWEGVFPPTSL